MPSTVDAVRSVPLFMEGVKEVRSSTTSACRGARDPRQGRVVGRLHTEQTPDQRISWKSLSGPGPGGACRSTPASPSRRHQPAHRLRARRCRGDDGPASVLGQRRVKERPQALSRTSSRSAVRRPVQGAERSRAAGREAREPLEQAPDLGRPHRSGAQPRFKHEPRLGERGEARVRFVQSLAILLVAPVALRPAPGTRHRASSTSSS
jgi:hypothetical protein